MTKSVPIILTIAGTDPSGGAGINVDLQVFRDFGGHGIAAITALVWQNTRKIGGWRAVKPVELRSQLKLLRRDFDIGAVKIGMLPTEALIEAVGTFLGHLSGDVSVVLDPVMVGGKGQASLMDERASRLLQRLALHVGLVTPNGPEARRLAELDENVSIAPEELVEAVMAKGFKRVLLTGGHLRADERSPVVDWLGDSRGVSELSGLEPVAFDVRGTGCQLSSAIAAGRASAQSWPEAIEDARTYLNRLLHQRARVISKGRPVVVRSEKSSK